MDFRKTVALLILATASAAIAQPLDDVARKKAMLDRAQSAELPGNWVPEPIAAASHFAAAYAQRL